MITWMVCSKHMKKQLKTYFEDVKEIQMIDDIMASYSHVKMNRICKYENIRILYQFFVDHHKDNFLSNFEGEKRDIYEEALDKFMENFRKETNKL